MPRWSEASQDTSQPGARSLFSAQTENRATRGRFTSIVVKCCTNDTGRVSNLPRTSLGLVYMSLVGSSMRWQNLFMPPKGPVQYFPGKVFATRTLHHSSLALLYKGVPDTGAASRFQHAQTLSHPAGQALAFWLEIGYTGCVIDYG